MREYTTLETIQALKDNKELVFTGKGATGSEVRAYVRHVEGIDTIMWKPVIEDEDRFTLTEYVLNMKWTKVQEPVDFMTALNSGKRFKHKDMTKYGKASDMITFIYKEVPTGIEDVGIKNIFNSKEWYVEE